MFPESGELFPFLEQFSRAGTGVDVKEFFPDVADGFFRGMGEVGGIEAIVAEVVEQEFVGREILLAGDGELKSGFRQGVVVEIVAQMAHGADSIYDSDGGADFGLSLIHI